MHISCVCVCVCVCVQETVALLFTVRSDEPTVFLMKYSWFAIWYKFQVYSMVIQHFYRLTSIKRYYKVTALIPYGTTCLKRLPQVDTIFVGINGCGTPEQRSQVGRLEAVSDSGVCVCLLNFLPPCKNWLIV